MIRKKSHPRFRVPNFGAKSRKGVPERWRKQRGIDNKMRVSKKGHGASPSIGYKNAGAIRFARKDGTREMLVHNEHELMAFPTDGKHVAVFAHDLSIRKRMFLQKIANSKGIKIANEASM